MQLDDLLTSVSGLMTDDDLLTKSIFDPSVLPYGTIKLQEQSIVDRDTGESCQIVFDSALGLVKYSTNGTVFHTIKGDSPSGTIALDTYDATGGQVFASSGVVSLKPVRVNSVSDAFTINGGEITFNVEGTFEIGYRTLMGATSSFAVSQSVLQLNGIDVPGTVSIAVVVSAYGETQSANIFLTVSPGDTIRIANKLAAGTGSLITVPNGSAITVKSY